MQEGGIRKRSFQMQSPRHLERNRFSSVIHSFQLLLLSISARAAPPAPYSHYHFFTAVPCFLQPRLPSFPFPAVCSCVNSPSSPISSFLYSLLTDFPQRERKGLSHQGRQSRGAQEPDPAQPSAPAAGTSLTFSSLLLSLFVSVKNAKSFGKPCLRNAHVSGIVFPSSPS